MNSIEKNFPFRIWYLSVLLMLPVLILYVSHFLVAHNKPDQIPTGYIIADMPYYMANALEYKEAPNLRLTYPLPFSADYENKPIYFHAQIFVMGVILRYTNIDPVFLFLVFGFVFCVLGIRICLLLLMKVTGLGDREIYLPSVLFIWGGGLLMISGFILALFQGVGWQEALSFKKSFALDPFEGWWFLNLGRNFIFPTEAYYHFLFFLAVYYLFEHKNHFAVLIALLLSISHPFTGIAILLIIFSWMIFELFIMKNKSMSKIDIALLILGLTWFGYYNFIFMPSNIEHKVLMDQWTLDWSMGAKNYLPGYILVLIPAFVRIGGKNKFKEFFSNSFNRFLLIWLFVNFALENHDLFFKPHQPLHFTRGYVWSCLFLIGAPVIIDFIKKIKIKCSASNAKVILIVFTIIFLLDNMVWFSLQSSRQYQGLGISLSKNQKDVLTFLNNNYEDKYVLLSQDSRIGYLSTALTPYRAYYSHTHNTPYADYRRKAIFNLMHYCKVDSSLQSKNLIIVVKSGKDSCDFITASTLIYKNSGYDVYRKNAN